jgi:hypothetical protein
LGVDHQAAVLPEGECVMILKFKDVTSEQLHKLTQLIDSKLRSGELLMKAYPDKWETLETPWAKKFMPCTASGYWLSDRECDNPLAQITSTKVDNTLVGTFFEVTVTLVEHFLIYAGFDSTTRKQTEVIRTPGFILQEIMEALDLFPSD